MSSDTLARSRVLRGATAVLRAAIDDDLAVVAAAPAESEHDDAPAPAESPEVAAAREQAARVGYEDGFEAGRRAAEEQARAEVDAYAMQLAQAVAGLDAAAAALTQRQSVAVADVEQQVVTTAFAIAEAILGRELATAHDPGRDAILRALQLAPARADVSARLHPDDVATLGELATLAGERNINVTADAAVENGGCILDVGPCRIDAQVGPALARVREVLNP